jgi:hypothetical protein
MMGSASRMFTPLAPKATYWANSGTPLSPFITLPVMFCDGHFGHQPPCCWASRSSELAMSPAFCGYSMVCNGASDR